MMLEPVVRRLYFSRKLLLNVVGLLTLTVLVVFGLALAAQAPAQSPPSNPRDLTGTWQGTLHAGKDLRTVLKVSKGDDGGWKAMLYSIDQGGQGMPVASITLQGSTVKYAIPGIGGSYEGTLSADGNSISGTWSQGPGPLPLNLTRATEATAWTIPPPLPRLPPMAPDANPAFEVATIKPSNPDRPGRAFLVRGRQFSTINTTVSALITFAYKIQPKQIMGAPAWIESDKYDLVATPDGEGQPNDRQWRGMLQKLLVDRFKIAFHHDKKELSVYALVVGKNGPKLTKDTNDPNGLPGLFFQKPGVLNVRNATMEDFAGLMQTAVLDRPVVDESELQGRFDFTLTWTPDESQFGGLGIRVPPPSDSANAPPDLFTAMQEQLGLRFEATKAPVDVLVIDHVEKPSEN